VPLTQDQVDDIQTNAFFLALVAEVDDVLTQINAENIDFDSRLYISVGSLSIPVAMGRHDDDIILNIGVASTEDINTAAYSLTIPSIWFTG